MNIGLIGPGEIGAVIVKNVTGRMKTSHLWAVQNQPL
jgi:predicted dinucleotide-utilizing enzyme